jgi:hypothetical protein
MSAPQTGQASDESAEPELRAAIFLLIVQLLVKGDDDAVRAEQDLDVESFATNARVEHVDLLEDGKKPSGHQRRLGRMVKLVIW